MDISENGTYGQLKIAHMEWIVKNGTYGQLKMGLELHKQRKKSYAYILPAM